MTKHEMSYVCKFLAYLEGQLDLDGCNEITLPDTPENKQLVADAEKLAVTRNGWPQKTLSIRKGRIETMNIPIVSYLRHKLMEECGFTKEDLPPLKEME